MVRDAGWCGRLRCGACGAACALVCCLVWGGWGYTQAEHCMWGLHRYHVLLKHATSYSNSWQPETAMFQSKLASKPASAFTGEAAAGVATQPPGPVIPPSPTPLSSRRPYLLSLHVLQSHCLIHVVLAVLLQSSQDSAASPVDLRNGEGLLLEVGHNLRGWELRESRALALCCVVLLGQWSTMARTYVA